MLLQILLPVVILTTAFSQEIYRKEWTSFYPCKGNKYITISFENMQALDKNFYFYLTISKTLRNNAVISVKFRPSSFEKWNFPDLEFRLSNAVTIKAILDSKEKNPVFRLRSSYGISMYIASLTIDNVEYCSDPETDLSKMETKGDDRIFTPHIVIANNGSCGIRQTTENQTVSLTGTTTKSGDWPWHAVIKRVYNGIPQDICGGTLISKLAVLSAAHCFVEKHDSLSVILGKHNYGLLFDNPQQIQVSQVNKHPDFNEEYRGSDIAVLKLKSEVVFSEIVQPACLWHESDYKTISSEFKGMITGWSFPGHYSESPYLQQAYVSRVMQSVCARNEFFLSYLSDQNFCVEATDDATPCIGDDGSGFVVFVPNGVSGSWHVRGIISNLPPSGKTINGRRLCDGSKPALLTDVALFTPWLREFV